jgi:hypothetical protein
MSLTPASSISPSSVTIAGTVDVSDRAGRLLGHTDVDNFPASQAVTGPLTDAQLRASAVPVSGPLTDAQLRAAVVPVGDGGGSLTVDGTGVFHVDDNGGSLTVDGSVGVNNFPASQAVTGPLTDAQLRASDVGVNGSAHTQPVSAAALPLPTGAATEATLATLASEATLAAVEAALGDLATEETLDTVRDALNDVALTAILERERIEP